MPEQTNHLVLGVVVQLKRINVKLGDDNARTTIPNGGGGVKVIAGSHLQKLEVIIMKNISLVYEK